MESTLCNLLLPQPYCNVLRKPTAVLFQGFWGLQRWQKGLGLEQTDLPVVVPVQIGVGTYTRPFLH